MPVVHRLPAYLLNGIAVALGIGIIQFLVAATAGPQAGALAMSGAVCASLADVPNTVHRTAQRVPAAALLGWLTALAVALLQPHPVTLGLAVPAIVFIAMMTMAWGARAGAVSFAPILALVFTMATPPGKVPIATLALWHAAGALAYVGWSLLAGSVLQRRYRTLALCEALRATAALLRARARLLADPGQAADADALRSWIQGEAVLADRLQGARDFVFAAPDSARARRDSAILLSAIDLRDMLLASRLDLELLGSDASAQWLLDRAAEGLNQIASQLDAAVAALRSGTLPAAPADDDADRWFEQAPLAAEDARARLLPLIASRLRGLAADAARIHALLRGEPAIVPLSREQLRRFVAPEGWPLQALRAQWTGHSPVLRHALRAALALGSAYFIALALPWASHPHWLVLSVAVVLRGSLDQTLARRNARVLGTLFGCVLVVALTQAASAAWLTLVFLLAVATAHAFALQRYWVTATAATVMALLQAHMVNPGDGLAIGERIADTLLGAALAWAFCYVLPSWERRRLPLAVDRVLRDLDGYARHALAPQAADAVAPRLARRQAYDSLAALAAAMQRSRVEPAKVRVLTEPIAGLLDHGQRLMAQLSVVRLALARRGDELADPALALALADAQRRLASALDLKAQAAGSPLAAEPVDSAPLPAEAPGTAVLPWLLRRLQMMQRDAQQIRRAAATVIAEARLRTGQPDRR